MNPAAGVPGPAPEREPGRFRIALDCASWEAGFAAGAARKPATPAAADALAYFSGYIEGKAAKAGAHPPRSPEPGIIKHEGGIGP